MVFSSASITNRGMWMLSEPEAFPWVPDNLTALGVVIDQTQTGDWRACGHRHCCVSFPDCSSQTTVASTAASLSVLGCLRLRAGDGVGTQTGKSSKTFHQPSTYQTPTPPTPKNLQACATAMTPRHSRASLCSCSHSSTLAALRSHTPVRWLQRGGHVVRSRQWERMLSWQATLSRCQPCHATNQCGTALQCSSTFCCLIMK